MTVAAGGRGPLGRVCKAVAATAVALLLAIGAAQAAEPLLLFKMDFENASVVPSSSADYDQLMIPLPSGKSGAVAIQYEAGTSVDRYARVIDDPTTPGNRVLQYWLKEARIPGERPGYFKGRIQLNLTQVDKTVLYQKVRMFLHSDMVRYSAYEPANKWFAVSSLWAGAPWAGFQYPFLISLDLVKEQGSGMPLWFAASGEVLSAGRWSAVWSNVNRQFQVPIAEWFDLEVGYQQGNAQTGRFYVAVTPVSTGVRTEVLNVTNWTYHPRAPRPVPLTHWQPLKLYTSGAVIDYMREHGGIAQIFWDDLELWEPR